jgi:phosphomannomutase
MKKLIAFDLDGTLAPSKSKLPRRMAGLLDGLLENFEVCIITGGKYELIQHQVLSELTKSPELLKRLHIMPTSGTRYYSYDDVSDDWKLEYAEDIEPEQRAKIIKALEEALEESGYKVEKTYGETIEDRKSQITLSILGQDIVAQLGEEGLKMKESWDPDNSKKLKIRSIVMPKIPEFEVRSAGVTSIDVTKPGIDKGYGMKRLMEATGLAKEDILYFGDKIVEGGNDLAVHEMGIDCVAVRNWEDTAYSLEGINKVL